MQVLVALADARGAVVTRDQLIATCWSGQIVGDDAINRAVSAVRRALREAGSSALLETVPKVGFRLASDAEPLAADEGLSRRVLIVASAAAAAALGEAQIAQRGHDLAQLHERLEMIDGYRAESRAAALLHGLGFSAQQYAAPVASFSGGWRMRLNLARALIARSELLLLDEPTSGLDPIGTREMKDLILKLRDQGKTVVMCSHLLADVQDVCDRIAILHQGELKELGRVDSLITVQDVTQIRARGLSKAAEEEIRAVIARHHGEVLGMENPTTTLEELFLKIVRDSEARPGRRAQEKN